MDDLASAPQPGRNPIRGGHPLRMPDLATYESMGAGHTLARHVHDEHGQFKTDADRLAADPHIPASGGFTDRATAQRALDAAVWASASRITKWRRTADKFTPFIAEVPLDYIIGHNLSRELFDRGVRTSQPTTGVRFVLMPDARFASGFAVLTAYNVTVPATPARTFSILPLTAYAKPDGTTPLTFTSHPADVQFAAGVRSAARFTGIVAAHGAVAAGVRYWSADIEAWLSDPAAAPTLTRAYCGRSTIGQTLSRDEWAAGETRWTDTPVVIFTLRRDPSSRDGFAVNSAAPARSF